MFTCEVCGETTAPGTPLRRIPEGYRVIRYRFRRDAHLTSVRHKKKPVTRDDPGGIGYEWRGMLKACPPCYGAQEEAIEEMTERAEERVEEAVA